MRQFASFRAYHESGDFDSCETITATQEIYRELTALKAENAELKKKVGRIDELAQKNAAMESRLAALEKLITRQHVALNGGAK